MNRKRNLKTLSEAVVAFVVVPAALIAGVALFNDRKYMLASVVVACLSCVPFFIAFEKGRNTVRELVVIAVMSAITVVGRVIVAPVPGFKPVAALVIITGAALGAEAGFVTGAMAALASNVFFGQGPWTPFQMFAWGIIGFLAGLCFFGRKKVGAVALAIAGVVGGILFSLIMDVWTTVSVSGDFIVAEYVANVVAALPVTVEYSASNAIFLAVLAGPFTRKLERIKTKYGVFGGANEIDCPPESE